jgi:cell wall assembly regulator SMI1
MTAELIESLSHWLAANRCEYFRRLQPGVSDATLDAFEDQFHLQLPPPFRELYRWRNGQEPTCSASFQGNRMFCSLDEVADTKATLDGMIGFDFEEPRWWRRSWIPFLANGASDYLCLDLATEGAGTPGQLVAFWHDRDARLVEYASLDDWLFKLVDSMNTGTLKVV